MSVLPMLAATVLVTQLTQPVKVTVPPPTPGPVPSLSERRVMTPPVSVMWWAPTLTLMFRPAFPVRFPPVIVMSELRLTSRPAMVTKLPPVVVTADPASRLTSSTAFKVSVAADVQVTASLTMMSPAPATLPA